MTIGLLGNIIRCGKVLAMCEYGGGLVVATETGVYVIRSYTDMDTGLDHYSVSTLLTSEPLVAEMADSASHAAGAK